MIHLLVGPKGSGKTQRLIEDANDRVKNCEGNVIFIKNSHNDTYSLSFSVRAVCMDDYPSIRNVDDYIGFIYGMISANSDIQVIFIDGILKQSDIKTPDIPRFLERLDNIAKRHGVEFYVSISAAKDDLSDINVSEYDFI